MDRRRVSSSATGKKRRFRRSAPTYAVGPRVHARAVVVELRSPLRRCGYRIIGVGAPDNNTDACTAHHPSGSTPSLLRMELVSCWERAA